MRVKVGSLLPHQKFFTPLTHRSGVVVTWSYCASFSVTRSLAIPVKLTNPDEYKPLHRDVVVEIGWA